MTVQRTVYASPVDALAALVRSLVEYEQRHKMASADFYARYERGELGDSAEFVEWAGDYQQYLHLQKSAKPSSSLARRSNPGKRPSFDRATLGRSAKLPKDSLVG